jgi:protein-disulfide isomerase
VTIHVWSDYQCALCVAVEHTISDLQKDYGERIRFVWHDLPLPRHEDARRIALAEREAYAQKGAQGFWALHHAISFAPQVPTAVELDGFAKAAKLDMHQWRSALDGNTHARDIEADEKAARDEGITETPAFLIATDGASQGAFVGNIEYASKLRRVLDGALDAQ